MAAKAQEIGNSPSQGVNATGAQAQLPAVSAKDISALALPPQTLDPQVVSFIGPLLNQKPGQVLSELAKSYGGNEFIPARMIYNTAINDIVRNGARFQEGQSAWSSGSYNTFSRTNDGVPDDPFNVTEIKRRAEQYDAAFQAGALDKSTEKAQLHAALLRKWQGEGKLGDVTVGSSEFKGEYNRYLAQQKASYLKYLTNQMDPAEYQGKIRASNAELSSALRAQGFAGDIAPLNETALLNREVAAPYQFPYRNGEPAAAPPKGYIVGANAQGNEAPKAMPVNEPSKQTTNPPSSRTVEEQVAQLKNELSPETKRGGFAEKLYKNGVAGLIASYLPHGETIDSQPAFIQKNVLERSIQEIDHVSYQSAQYKLGNITREQAVNNTDRRDWKLEELYPLPPLSEKEKSQTEPSKAKVGLAQGVTWIELKLDKDQEKIAIGMFGDEVNAKNMSYLLEQKLGAKALKDDLTMLSGIHREFVNGKLERYTELSQIINRWSGILNSADPKGIGNELMDRFAVIPK